MAEQFSFDQVFEMAKAGNLDAQYFVGMAFFQGNGVERNYGVSIHWIFKAAEGGQKDAIDVKTKIMESAEAGDFETIKLVFMAAEYGHKDVIDVKTKIEKKAYPTNVVTQEGGNPDLQYFLAIIYSQGIGVNKDEGEGGTWLLRAAKNGHKDAIALIEKTKWSAYAKLPLAGISLVLLVVLNMIIKGSHFMFFINTTLVGLFISNLVEPIQAIFVAKNVKNFITITIFGLFKGILGLAIAVFVIVMTVQSCGGKEIDNKLYNFLQSPTEYIIGELPGSDLSEQTPARSSNKFFTQRDIKKLQEENSDVKSVIISMVILVGTYFFFRFLVIKKLFRGSGKAKVVVGFFIPIAIFAGFFTAINYYILLVLIGIGMSWVSIGELAKAYKK